MTTYAPVLFTDISSGVTGTVLDQATLGTLVVSGTCLLSGTTPSTSANLTLTYGQQQFVVQGNAAGIDNGGGAAYYTLASGTLTVAASKDTYIEVGATGVITQNAVNNGAAAPTQTTNTIRLWKVVSSASAITGVELWCPAATVINLGKLMVPQQTGNTGATSVANLCLGTYRIAAGSGSGVTAFNQVIPNTQITAQSVVLLTLCAPIDIITCVAFVPGSNVAGTSFTINVTKSATSGTGSAVDVEYLILN